MTTLREYLLKLRDCFTAHANEFEDIFGRRLREFWDVRTGFDIVKFDLEFVKPPEGVSCRDCVIERFGERAATLIDKLISNKS